MRIMTKNEFMHILTHGLESLRIDGIDDILEEYEDHFTFKMADGYSEEEIAAKLGDPAELARQFATDSKPTVRRGGNVGITGVGLGFADFFVAIFFVLLWAWEVVMAALTVSAGIVGIGLFGGQDFSGLIPNMPYWCGAVFGLAAAALAVLAAAGCVYFAAFTRQLMRVYGRFHRNVMARAAGRPVLPPLAVRLQFVPGTRKNLRKVTMIALVLLAVCSVAGYVVAALSAGNLEFWHVWHWFE
jgi:hypothetical protein